MDSLIGWLLFERRLGTKTGGIVPFGALGTPETGGNAYVPTEWFTLRSVFKHLDVGSDDVFFDYGAGKGRAVVYAARYPFKRVLGIEISPELAEIARENVKRAHRRLRSMAVEIVTANARDYELPDDVTVVYLYDPFTGEIFPEVLERLVASVDRNPRIVRLIYNLPQEQTALMLTGRVRQIRSWRLRSMAMYVVLPRGESRHDGADSPLWDAHEGSVLRKRP